MSGPHRQSERPPLAPISLPDQQHVQAPPHHHHHHHTHSAHHPHTHSVSTPASMHGSAALLHAQPGQPPPAPGQATNPLPVEYPGAPSNRDAHHHHGAQHMDQAHHHHPAQQADGQPSMHQYPNPDAPQLAHIVNAPTSTDPAALLASAVPAGAYPGTASAPYQPSRIPLLAKLDEADEQTWLLIGAIAEQMLDLDTAVKCYHRALGHNPHSKNALAQIGGIARAREDFPMAIEYLSRVLTLDQQNGELWSALGHCYLMLDALDKAYSAYQQALYCLQDPTNVKLWYGIGILYDRYGSLEHAEEAFTSVLRMEEGNPSRFNTNEVLFRLGVIYKQQHKYDDSLACFERITDNPPYPLRGLDIWFQIGHVYEQKADWENAKLSYERVLVEQPQHAKVLQQLGWLYFQTDAAFHSTDNAIECLTRSLGAGGLNDESDAQSWYLLGRAYMAAEKYNKAYEAYQQAVYRDGRNPTFWCSIGVLYYQIQQFRDALDAYSRAIRINPFISEVWFDLGCLYESCNNQISDAIDAYKRALELDPDNPNIHERLRLLEEHKMTGGPAPAPPPVQDVHPTAYASSHGHLGPTNSLGPPFSLGIPTPRDPYRPRFDLPGLPHTGLRPPPGPSPSVLGGSRGGMASPPPGGATSVYPPLGSEPYRPPTLASIETSRSGLALAPMIDIQRTGAVQTQGMGTPLPSIAPHGEHHGGEQAYGGGNGSHASQQYGHPQQHGHAPPSRGPYDPARHDVHPGRPSSRLTPPVRPAEQHGPPGPRSSHHSLLNPVTPPQQQPQSSYHYNSGSSHAERQDPSWERRGEQPPPHFSTMPPAQPASAPHYYLSRDNAPREATSTPSHRQYEYQARPSSPRRMPADSRGDATRSPVAPYPTGEPSWDSRAPLPPSGPATMAPPGPQTQFRRYDPRFDSSDEPVRREPPPEAMDVDRPPRVVKLERPAHIPPADEEARRASGSPMPRERKRKGKERDPEESARKEKRPRKAPRKGKDEMSDIMGASPAPSRGRGRGKTSPDSVGRRASARASPVTLMPAPPAPVAAPPPPSSRIVDEDYDEGVAVNSLIRLSAYRPPVSEPVSTAEPTTVEPNEPPRPQLPVPQRVEEVQRSMQPSPVTQSVSGASSMPSGQTSPSVSRVITQTASPTSGRSSGAAVTVPLPLPSTRTETPAPVDGPPSPRPVPQQGHVPSAGPVPFGPSPPPPPAATIQTVEASNAAPVGPALIAPTPLPLVAPAPPVPAPPPPAPAPVFLGPPRPPEMLQQEPYGPPPPPRAPVTPTPPSLLSNDNTPAPPADDPVSRKRATPPSASPEPQPKRARVDITPSPPSSPRARTEVRDVDMAPAETAPAPVAPFAPLTSPPPPPTLPIDTVSSNVHSDLTAVVQQSPTATRSPPPPPPIATLEDVSSPESARMDQLLESPHTHSPASAPPADAEVRSSTAAEPSSEQSPMDTGD